MSDGPSTIADRAGGHIRGDRYSAEAGWFGPEDRPRFGWLYRPDTPAGNGVGIVIVPPFGRADICAHRTLRHLAEDAASAGLFTVRFDLDGTGDSVGSDADPGRLGAWCASIQDACDLARGAGATQLVLVGVRLGATLAALSAAQRVDIAALITFDAVVSGKAWLRELRAFQAAMNLQPAPEPVADAGQETSGFLLSTETCAALKALDLTVTNAAPAPRALLLERDDMPERKAWPEHLRALGVEVRVQRVPGYVEMMNDPHASRVAQAFIDASIDCTRNLPQRQGNANAFNASPSLRSSIRNTVDSVAIIEEIVAPTEGMFGILVRPDAGNVDHALLMLNAGAIRRIGSNRSDVPLARQLAARGMQVLRIDLPGIGDSKPHAGEPENLVYGPHCVADVGVAVAWLRARGARELAVGGMCSGAYHALRAAIAGQAIDNIYLINCGVFSAKVHFDPEGSNLFGDISHYNQAVKTPGAWRKLLTGKVAFGTVTRVAAWHIRNQGRRFGKGIARGLRLPLRDDLGSQLLALSRRGVRVHFLFSVHEPGRAILAAEAGSIVLRQCKTGQASLREFAGTDHTFTQRWAQVLLGQAVEELLAPKQVSDR